MRIAVVENESMERQQICSSIMEYLQKRNIPADLRAYDNGEEIVKEARQAFDVIFMDIDMDGLNGMEAAGRIRLFDSQVMIVFITNMAGYAIDGYSVQALDFMIKPVSAQRMEQELDKITSLLKKRSPQKIVLKSSGSIYQLDKNDIFYIEMYGRKVRVHYNRGVVELNSTLRYFEEFLSPSSFFRCHHAFLVNMAYVSSIEKTDVIVKETRIPLSRQRKKEFVQTFARYLGGSL